jgi:protein required for attachment to host cells
MRMARLWPGAAQAATKFAAPAFTPQPPATERAMQIPPNSVILVADGRKSLFFRNQGDADFPNFGVVEKDVHPNPSHHEQASDLAGRASGMLGSSMEEVDFHQQEEDRFAADTAAMLKDRALRHEFDALVVVAPPHTLGELRKHYHPEVEKRLIAELPKDLVNTPVAEIEKILQGA